MRPSFLVLSLAFVLVMAVPDGAYGQAEPDGFVDVVKVTGYLDPVLVDFVEGALADAGRAGDVAVVLQLDSPGALVSTARLERLVAAIRRAVPLVGVWIGPSGGQAAGDAAQLVEAADVVGISPSSHVEIAGRRIAADQALEEEIADNTAPTLGDFIVGLPGVETRQVQQGDEPRLEPVTPVRFRALGLLDQLAHTVGSPAVAYLLFVIGLGLILFEFFTAGVGVAGLTGAGAFALGCYGLAVLPTTWFGVALLVVAMFGFGVDIQTGVPRVWTGIGTVAFVLGSLVIYDGIQLSWITLLVSILGMVVAMLAGMPAMVRSRFSTPTIGRDWMIDKDEVGSAAFDPDGIVQVRDAPWRARTNRATPIAAGAEVRVAAIDGLVLEVEPLEGAAKDYRDRH